MLSCRSLSILSYFMLTGSIEIMAGIELNCFDKYKVGLFWKTRRINSSYISKKIVMYMHLSKFQATSLSNFGIQKRYRISANSSILFFFEFNLMYCDHITVHTGAETIQGRKLFAEIRYIT